jgi:DNA-binding response OmpR family regulator
MRAWNLFATNRVRVLVVDADTRRARLTAAAVAARMPNSEVEIALTLARAETRLLDEDFGAVIACADLAHPSNSAVVRLRPLLEGALIIASGPEMTDAMDAMRAGADDVLIGGIEPHLAAQRLAARVEEQQARGRLAGAAACLPGAQAAE